MSRPTVSVIIVSYGTRDYTLSALASVRAAREEVPLEAIVVDNASPDDSALAIAREHPWVKLLRHQQNLGFAAGANRGASEAQGTWLLFLNSDASLPRGSLSALYEAATTLPSVGAISPRIENPDGKVERPGGHFISPWRDFVQMTQLDRLFPRLPCFEGVVLTPRLGPVRKVDWVTGACLLVRHDVFTDVGRFDEHYFLYVEDMDLCYRLAMKGLVNYYVPDVTIHHALGMSRHRNSSVLIDGGSGPEYFVRKFGRRYPLLLHRGLRASGLAIWLVKLELRQLLGRIRGRATPNTSILIKVCRKSLLTLLWPPSQEHSTMRRSPKGGG